MRLFCSCRGLLDLIGIGHDEFNLRVRGLREHRIACRLAARCVAANQADAPNPRSSEMQGGGQACTGGATGNEHRRVCQRTREYRRGNRHGVSAPERVGLRD